MNRNTEYIRHWIVHIFIFLFFFLHFPFLCVFLGILIVIIPRKLSKTIAHKYFLLHTRVCSHHIGLSPDPGRWNQSSSSILSSLTLEGTGHRFFMGANGTVSRSRKRVTLSIFQSLWPQRSIYRKRLPYTYRGSHGVGKKT